MGYEASTPQRTVTVEAPAKINLALHITGVRNDGYHLLDSLVFPISLTDIVTVQRTQSGGIAVACPGYPELATTSNLAVRAARLYFELAEIDERTDGVAIELIKRIPVAAGLGGGSSDAAATLRALQALFGYPLADEVLKSEAVRLGADVPVLIDCAPRWVSGIGEVLGETLQIEPLWLVLANPGYPVSTRWVYENYKKKLKTNRLTKPDIGVRKSGRFLDREAVSGGLCNDLESVTLQKHPDLFQMKDALRKASASETLMSGSGPTIFGLFDSDRIAASTVSILQAAYPTWSFWSATNFTSEDDRRGRNGDH
jgi:4-diphosphocytidyl-2-C-methyl-D-erythritol kinase